ncbi:MAG: LysM peptidoglycan-binding domain-containing protein, partial [Proteobacteria bacterium]|nr:LysM peptidoglycan-binding domain-containing protein [Pseudomonadota bacterium]
PTWRIRKENRLRYGKAIMVGQEIRIPLRKGGQGLFEEKRYEYHKELVEDFFAAYRVDRVTKYKVKSGDNIWTLCRNEFDLPFWLVKQYNQSLKPNGLKPSQELLIPVVSRRQTDVAAFAGKGNVGS